MPKVPPVFPPQNQVRSLTLTADTAQRGVPNSLVHHKGMNDVYEVDERFQNASTQAVQEVSEVDISCDAF